MLSILAIVTRLFSKVSTYPELGKIQNCPPPKKKKKKKKKTVLICLPRNIVVRLTDPLPLDMTIAVDWDVKPQIHQNKQKIDWYCLK